MKKPTKKLVLENKLLAILTLITILTGITAASIHIIEDQHIDRMEMTENVSFNVTEHQESYNQTDFGVETGSHLNYGEMPEGTNQTRTLNLTTTHATIAQPRAQGNVSDYLVYEDIVAYQGEKMLDVKLDAREPGYYEGELIIEFQAPKTRYGLRWMDIKYQYFY